MAQFYIARFRDDPLIFGVPFEPAHGEDLVTAAIVALSTHASDRAIEERWEFRIAGPFQMGPERLIQAIPSDHLGQPT